MGLRSLYECDGKGTEKKPNVSVAVMQSLKGRHGENRPDMRVEMRGNGSRRKG